MATRTELKNKLGILIREANELVRQVEAQNQVEDLLVERGITLIPADLKALDDKLQTAPVKNAWDAVVAEYIASKPSGV